ncbi:MauE/DoxX family redox-associated membrane protein [Streptomyces sp. NPDC006197]|uniref:MauE/DoxX family redox-associated membrane protein n=1 Tax=Streptomyces sp. NPDC006197 TaxID=3156685 RepID=UPI0033A52321
MSVDRFRLASGADFYWWAGAVTGWPSGGGASGVLVVPATARTGASVAGLLVAVFTAGIVLARRRGTAARCACFGRTPMPLGRRHVVRNVLLLGDAVALQPAGAEDLLMPHSTARLALNPSDPARSRRSRVFIGQEGTQ